MVALYALWCVTFWCSVYFHTEAFSPVCFADSHIHHTTSLPPFYLIPPVPFVVTFPPLSFPKLSFPPYLLYSLPRTEPMFRFKFADAGNMSPPLISFSEVAFSYSGAKTHTHTHVLYKHYKALLITALYHPVIV
jgi:hypothetical protein